tara:strand:+ start:75137 stop:76342 length:1206 start_codon:yes stop_codon:yes gene_type:complete
MRTYSLYTFLLFFCLYQNSSAQIAVGGIVPEPSLELVLQAPVSKLDSWSILKDKWVFVEFWATWCAPCIAKIPDLNALQKELINENIQFISISPEKPEKVKRFLERKSISGWVGVDTDNSFISDMKVSKYPTTILISPDGKVHSIIDQNDLKKESLLLTIRNEIKSFSVKENSNELTVDNKTKGSMSMGGGTKGSNTNELTDYYVKIEKSDAQGGFVMGSQGKLKSNSMSLPDLIAIAYGTSKFYVLGKEDILKTRYSVDISLPQDQNIFQQMLQSSLGKQLNIIVTKENRSVPAYVLSSPNGITKNLYKSDINTKRKVSAAEGVIAVSSSGFDGFFITQLENLLNAKIINKTNLNDKYDYNLYWDKDHPKSIIDALKEQLGLEIEAINTDAEVLIVSSSN